MMKWNRRAPGLYESGEFTIHQGRGKRWYVTSARYTSYADSDRRSLGDYPTLAAAKAAVEEHLRVNSTDPQEYNEASVPAPGTPEANKMVDQAYDKACPCLPEIEAASNRLAVRRIEASKSPREVAEMVLAKYSLMVEIGPDRDMDGSPYSPDIDKIIREMADRYGYTYSAVDHELYLISVGATEKCDCGTAIRPTDGKCNVCRSKENHHCPCGSERMPVSIDGQLVCEDCIDEMAVLVS